MNVVGKTRRRLETFLQCKTVEHCSANAQKLGQCEPSTYPDRTGADPKMSTKRPFVKKVIHALSAMKREAHKLSWCY